MSYSNVDWEFLKSIYGWAAVQYQAWVRGELFVPGNTSQQVILHTDSILEYWIDDKHYFGGDFYSFRKAPPVLTLQPGAHRIDLRLVRDVRAFGGILEPSIDVVIEVKQASGTLEPSKPGILMADVVDGKLASRFGSVYLRNSGVEDIQIVRIRPSNTSQPGVSGSNLESQSLLAEDTRNLILAQGGEKTSIGHNTSGITIAAGQTRSVALNLSLSYHNSTHVAIDVIYKTLNDTHSSILEISQEIRNMSMYDPHKITFLHPGGIVSYAMLRPPASNATCHSGRKNLPVLLGLHGAGLEADNPMVTGALDPVSDLCAWVVFPTGVTPWSGDDWHNWGFADVEAAVQAIPTWIESNGWQGPDVDIDRWIVSGHSNGGQGTWIALTHRPE